MARVRLDVLVAQQGLAQSREKAQALIMAGLVSVDGTPAQKPGQLVLPSAVLGLREREPYVSRGGYKLAHALDSFRIRVMGLVAVDVGASTGGFTDVLLQRGAQRVYAVDVGRGQLHARLRQDPRVVVLDRTNVRFLEALPERPQLATIDVSFISLRLVVPAVNRLLAPGSSIIVLVKPQFEAGRQEIGRGGIVRSMVVHRNVLSELVAWIRGENLGLAGLVASPVRGAAGNAEFLAWLVPLASELPAAERLVEVALEQVHARDPRENPRQ
jgi:23S rRNA (cytidine1920-2'-O)/16S rRNA (cytidine1409-2'-O)-methyltransferase